MGSFFTNIQIRHPGALSDTEADRIAALLTDGGDWTRVDDEDADITVDLIEREDSAWVTVVSDLFDSDDEAQMRFAKRIAEQMETPVLAIGCFDSDYLYLNLIDPATRTDAWAANGSFPEGNAPRRSNYAAWKGHVPDVDAFRAIMRKRRVFAEDSLIELEPILSLPVEQGQCCPDFLPEDCRVRRYAYKSNRQTEDAEPTVFAAHCPSLCYRVDGEFDVVSFVNKGGASRGVAVVLAGPCVEGRQVRVTSACLQYFDARGDWAFDSVELTERMTQDGKRTLYGEAPDFRIPEAVDENLPWRRKSDLEFQRSVSVRFSLEKADPDLKEEELSELYLTLVPLQNWAGWAGWTVMEWMRL